MNQVENKALVKKHCYCNNMQIYTDKRRDWYLGTHLFIQHKN